MKSKTKKNLAKDIVKPKTKQIDLPDVAKIEVKQVMQNLDTYITGVVAGLGIESKWAFDLQKLKIMVEDKP